MSLKEKIIKPKSPEEQQRKVLQKLLNKAKDTEFGMHYQFEDILSRKDVLAQFQKHLPIFDYESMHTAWWKKSIAGQANIAWPGEVSYFALTSGTSIGGSKYIPVTKDHLKSIQKVGAKIFLSFAKKEHRHLLKSKVFVLGGTTALQEESGYAVGDLSGINVGQSPFWFRRLYVPEREITGISNWEDRIDAIVQKAPEWNIGIIAGIPSWVYLLLDKIIKHHKLNTIHDIWPNLGAFVHGGISFAPYRESFKKLLGKPLVYFDTYLASEGFLAYQKKPEDDFMTLVLNKGIFFEFIPFDDLHYADGELINTKGIVDISKVKEGIDYAIVLTNSAGAWRYQIGDVIRFVNAPKAQIKIVGRTKLFLSVCGEHLSIDNINMGVEKVRAYCGDNIVNFTVYAEEVGDYFRHKWFLGTHHPLKDHDLAVKTLDNALKELNDDYRTERGAVLKDMELVVLDKMVFIDFMKEQGKTGGQHKFPKVLKGKIKDDWIAFLRKLNHRSK